MVYSSGQFAEELKEGKDVEVKEFKEFTNKLGSLRI
jgi:hypothetical protein